MELDIFHIIFPAVFAGLGAVGGVMFQRKRERITWEESAKGHLAKIRHEAVAKCLAGVGELYEAVYQYRQSCDSEDEEKKQEEERRRAAAGPLAAIAAHEFLLPPDLRREVQTLLSDIHPYNHRLGEAFPKQADALCVAIDRYLPPIERREVGSVEKLTSAKAQARSA